MATRRQVREQLEAGADYDAIGARLHISPGLAYLIGTGLSADGSDAPSAGSLKRPGALPSSQTLTNGLTAENTTAREIVRGWIRSRIALDAQMRSTAAKGE